MYLWQGCIYSFTQHYNNLRFYCAIINWNFIWNIDLNNGVYCDLRNKSACLNMILLQPAQKCRIYKIQFMRLSIGVTNFYVNLISVDLGSEKYFSCQVYNTYICTYVCAFNFQIYVHIREYVWKCIKIVGRYT